MTELFSAYELQVPGAKIPAYLIESTAPNNIDDPDTDQRVPKYTEKISANAAIDSIVRHLKEFKNPTLVVNVHGFNSPRNIILEGYGKSFESINKDTAINGRDVLCIGYRWPSEHMGAPFTTAFKAAPWFLIVFFVVGVALSAAALLAPNLLQILRITIGGFGAFVLTISFTLFLLRIVVYFRDGYRATSFGVPDLVEVIRQIDKNLAPGERDLESRVELSFIAHSMGAYVVTSVVRILSDVFDPKSMNSSLSSTDAKPLPEIGHAFKLARLVLVSPDIPAEALISNRANFLSASLKRFEEKFLFSNEGDEVLRQISTTANYFSFPTRSNRFGYRLGNICLPRKPWGINKGITLNDLQVGQMTIEAIYNNLNIQRPGSLRYDLPTRFSYFDCTDCVDETEHGMKGMLTLAKPGGQNKLMAHNHLLLLLCYIIFPRKCDVHGGYFRSPFLSKLIYRLACIGYVETEQAYIKEGPALDTRCQDHQIKVLLKS